MDDGQQFYDDWLSTWLNGTDCEVVAEIYNLLWQ